MIKPKQKNVAFIFARGGSKELKNKNIYQQYKTINQLKH